MLGDGLIEETEPPKDDRDASAEALERRRYFALTPLGREAARLEARRMQQLVADARTQRLLKAGRKS
jgi:hypothetical protein